LNIKDVIKKHLGRVEKLGKKNPSLGLIHQELKRFTKSGLRSDAKSVESILGAWEKSAAQLDHLINPIGLPLQVTDNGRIATKTFENVAVLLTDIRGFTELGNRLVEEWNLTVFDFLSYCYFPLLVEVLENFGCHYLNYTGDGLLIVGEAQVDQKTGQKLAALDNMVLCAFQLVEVSDLIAKVWAEMGLKQKSGVLHETGIGISFGRIEVGDPFVPDHLATGKLLEFQTLFGRKINTQGHHWKPRKNFRDRIRGIHALGPVINLASRLQDTDKRVPDHTCMIEKADCERLSPPIRKLYETLGMVKLPGLGEREIFGVRRKSIRNIEKLKNACLRVELSS
jgi:class 3 adenylate cyclase